MMEYEYNTFHWVMLWLGAAGLGIVVITWLTVFGFVPIWNEIRRLASLPRIQQIFVVLFTFGTIHAAATKPIIRFDGGIKPGANKSWVTNDTIHIEWQRDLSSGVYVPETAAVYIDYRPNTETNAEWGLLAQTTVGAWSWEGTLADATNYDYNVWAYYIPPEPVHTNGVWVYKTMMDRPGKHIIPLRARVEVNGIAISTPLAERNIVSAKDYERNGLRILYDGIENAGFGLHSNSVTTWTNLVDGGPDAVVNWGAAPTATDNSVHFTKNVVCAYKIASQLNRPNQITVEVCHNAKHWGTYGTIALGIESGNCGFQNVKFAVGNPSGGYYNPSPTFTFAQNNIKTMTGVVGLKIKSYLNGVLKSSGGNTSAGIRWTDIGYMTIGGDLGQETSGGIEGDIYCIRVYDRELTPEEIAHNFAIDKARFNLP